jgi:hypothetical protein
VTFINTDGMALIGPGSEWFWTAVSGLVLSVTFFAIWRQLRVQVGANTFAQLQAFNNELNSERLLWAYRDILVASQRGVPPEDLPHGAADAMAAFWESVGLLVRGRNLDRRAVYDQFSYGVQYDWARLRPYAEKIRAETGMPAILEHFEWLAKEMAGIDRRKGQEIVFDAAYLAARLPASLDRCTSQLRFFERSRAVYLGEAPVAETVTGPVTEKAPAQVA